MRHIVFAICPVLLVSVACGGENVELQARELTRQSGRLVIPILLDGKEHAVELDTGCSSLDVHGTASDPRFSKMTKTTRVVQRFDGPHTEEFFHTISIRVMGQAPKYAGFSLSDRSAFEHAFGVPKEALVGMACIRSEILHVVPRTAVIGRTTFPTSIKSAVMDLSWSEGCPVMTASVPLLGEQSVLLDSASDAWLSLTPSRLQLLQRGKNAVLLENRPILTPGGIITIQLFAVRYVDVAGVRFHNVPVVASHVEAIGLGLLQYFDMTLDFPNSRASFVPLDLARDQMPLDASGLRVVFRESDRLVVRRIVPDSPAEKAGFKEGDRILNFAGREPATLWRHEIQETLAKAGDTIHLRIEREGKPSEIDLPLSRPFQYPPEWPPEPPEFNPDAVPETPGEKDASSRP